MNAVQIKLSEIDRLLSEVKELVNDSDTAKATEQLPTESLPEFGKLMEKCIENVPGFTPSNVTHAAYLYLVLNAGTEAKETALCQRFIEESGAKVSSDCLRNRINNMARQWKLQQPWKHKPARNLSERH